MGGPNKRTINKRKLQYLGGGSTDRYEIWHGEANCLKELQCVAAKTTSRHSA